MMTRAMMKNKQLMMRRTVAWLVDEGALGACSSSVDSSQLAAAGLSLQPTLALCRISTIGISIKYYPR